MHVLIPNNWNQVSMKILQLHFVTIECIKNAPILDKIETAAEDILAPLFANLIRVVSLVKALRINNVLS